MRLFLHLNETLPNHVCYCVSILNQWYAAIYSKLFSRGSIWFEIQTQWYSSISLSSVSQRWFSTFHPTVTVMTYMLVVSYVQWESRRDLYAPPECNVMCESQYVWQWHCVIVLECSRYSPIVYSRFRSMGTEATTVWATAETLGTNSKTRRLKPSAYIVTVFPTMHKMPKNTGKHILQTPQPSKA